jgi:hypothetical protein
MLLVYCTDTTKEVIDEIIKNIDTDQPPGGKNVMEMVALKYMDATDMVAILTEYLKVSKRTPSESGRMVPWWMDAREVKDPEQTVLAGDMRLKAIESLNAIMVTGKPEGVADVKAKIAELDVQNKEGADVPQTIALVNAHATELADMLKSVFNDPARNKGRGATYTPPTIVANDATNTLVVRAKPSEFNQIKDMALAIDAQMKDEPSGIHMVRVPPERGNIEELARTIEKQLNDAENDKQRASRDYRPSLVRINADIASNTLMVSGSKAKIDEVQTLVEQLVAFGPVGLRTRRVIKLDSLTPQQAKQLLEQLQPKSNSRGGSRGDADWRRGRRFERMIDDTNGLLIHEFVRVQETPAA